MTRKLEATYICLLRYHEMLMLSELICAHRDYVAKLLEVIWIGKCEELAGCCRLTQK